MKHAYRTISCSDIQTRSPWVDVRAYGIVGDGVTDDSTAIQSAINSLTTDGGGTVVLTKPCAIATGLTMGSNIVLTSTGFQNSLTYTGSDYAITMNGNESLVNHIQLIVGLTAIGGVKSTSASTSVIRNKVIDNIIRSSAADSFGSGRIAVLLEGDAVGGSVYPNYWNSVKGNRIDNWDTGIKTTTPSGDANGKSQAHFIDDNIFRNIRTYAVDLADSSDENKLMGNFVDGANTMTATLHLTGIRNMVLGWHTDMGGTAKCYVIDSGANNNILFINDNCGGTSVDSGTGNHILTPAGLLSIANDDLRHPNLTNAVDDAAAATAGVTIGEFYRNGSTLMVRVA